MTIQSISYFLAVLYIFPPAVIQTIFACALIPSLRQEIVSKVLPEYELIMSKVFLLIYWGKKIILMYNNW